jgi:hypothetical protein
MLGSSSLLNIPNMSRLVRDYRYMQCDMRNEKYEMNVQCCLEANYDEQQQGKIQKKFLV